MFYNVEEVNLWLESKFNQEKQELNVLKVIKDIGNPQQIYRLIKSILADHDALETVASRSYKHNNGFDKVVLAETGDKKYTIRLHIWWSESSNINDLDVHDHRWNFSSSLLTGTIKVEQFEYSDYGQNMYKYIYFPPSEEDKNPSRNYCMQFISMSKVECVYENILIPGSSYYMNHNVLHRVSNIAPSLTSTLLIHGESLNKQPVVLTNRLLKSGFTSQEKFTVSTLKNKLEKYLQLLK